MFDFATEANKSVGWRVAIITQKSGEANLVDLVFADFLSAVTYIQFFVSGDNYAVTIVQE